MWELSKPLAAKWVASQTNPDHLIKEARSHITRFIQLVPTLLDRLEEPHAPPQPPAEKRKSPFNTALSGAIFVTLLWIITHYLS